MMAGIGVELRGEQYWSLALDQVDWQQELPSGITSENLRGLLDDPEGHSG